MVGILKDMRNSMKEGVDQLRKHLKGVKKYYNLHEGKGQEQGNFLLILL